MAKNRIIVFANQKGGVGKTTLCCLMAHWLAKNDKNVVVYDADLQRSLYDKRKAEMKMSPDAKPAWDVKLIDTLDSSSTKTALEEAAQFQGYVLIDAPGSLALPGLALIFQIADAVVIPFSYEFNVLQSTSKFIQVLLGAIGQEKERLFYIPNMIDDRIGTNEEKAQAEVAQKELNTLGRVTYRIKRGVAVQRCSTLSVTSYQIHATMGPWTTILNKLNRLK